MRLKKSPNIYNEKDRKIEYLTFDNGPEKHTFNML